jgi:quercetin dioxygenase-like cupin family protein
MIIHRAGSRPSREGPAETFTGRVRVDPVHMAEEPARQRSLVVTFEPGARTNWHTHPLGQMLFVMSGRGIAQVWGETPHDIRPGDVVWFEPGEKHWHGAAAATGMVHMAIQEALDGSNVDWLEAVTDDQYAGAQPG